MNKYYLVSNVYRNCKYVVKKRWYHKFIGRPFITIAKCEANTKQGAINTFKMYGHDFGLLNDKNQ